MSFNIVLFEPEIPQNTGNIIRTAVCTGAKVHIIRPFKFSLSDKYMKRAGMDYVKHTKINIFSGKPLLSGPNIKWSPSL